MQSLQDYNFIEHLMWTTNTNITLMVFILAL